MRLAIYLVIITCISASAMEAVVPNPLAGPGQPGSGAMPIGTPMSRPAMACEVELVVITSDKDQAGLARWAELAAAGYRLSHVTTVGANQWLYLERAVMGTPANLRLPAVVEQDRSVAEALRAQIQAAARERIQAMRPQPPVSGTPAPAAK